MKVLKLISVLLVMLLAGAIGIGCTGGSGITDDDDDDGNTLPYLPTGTISNWAVVPGWQNSNITKNITTEQDDGKDVMKMIWYTVHPDPEAADRFGQYSISASLANSGEYHEYDGLIFDFKTGPKGDFNIQFYLINEPPTHRAYTYTSGWVNAPSDWTTISIPWSNFTIAGWGTGPASFPLDEWLTLTGKTIEIRLGGDPRGSGDSETTYFRHIGFYKGTPDTSKAVWFPKN